MSTKERVRSDLGQTVATAGALDALQRNNSTGLEYRPSSFSGTTEKGDCTKRSEERALTGLSLPFPPRPWPE